MATTLPEVTMTVLDGGLGLTSASSAKTLAKVGVCSKGVPGSRYSHADVQQLQKDLGVGPLVEAQALNLSLAGGTVITCVANPSVLGTASAVVKSGVGAGTVAVGFGPTQAIAIVITTTGAQGVAKFTWAVGGGTPSAPVLVPANGGPFTVPGTLCQLTFNDHAGTFDAADAWTIDTKGVVTPGGGNAGAGTIAQACSPVDAYSVLITIGTAGGLGVGAFQYSLDAKADPSTGALVPQTQSAQITIPGSGVYVVPGTGLVLTMANAFTLDNVYSFTTTGPSCTNQDLQAAIVALLGDASKDFEGVHLVATPANAAAAATLAALADTEATAAFNAYRFCYFITECPTTESDATILAAFNQFTSVRVSVCAGDVDMLSPISSRVARRNCAWAEAVRVTSVEVGEDLANVGRGSLAGVKAIYRDERLTPALDAAGFTTTRTIIGAQGYFLTNGRVMAARGSDFIYMHNRRVMDLGCKITRAAELPYLNGDVRTNALGFIDERDAQAFENRVGEQLSDALVATGQASQATVVVNRAVNILSTNTQPVSVKIRPKAYFKEIDNAIGFSNPAIGT